jgi:hypothetical protein
VFIGHFGLAFAAKRVAPKTSLGTLIAAAEFVDLLWPAFLLAGVEHVRIAPGITRLTPLDFYDYPVSHSLLGGIAWAAGFALVYFGARRYGRGAIVLGMLVLSHWFLDAVVHRPDLPLTLHGAARVGFGLWNYPAAWIVLEGLLFATGVVIYLRTTEAKNRVGTYATLALIGFLLVTWLGGFFGPPPPSVKAVAIVTLSMSLLVLWAAWADRNRRVRKGALAAVTPFTAKRPAV